MDKVQKVLQKLNDKERVLVKNILTLLDSGNFQGLNMVKLKGRKDIFRVRKGDLRILFRLQNKNISVLAIERRSEKTYRNF